MDSLKVSSNQWSSITSNLKTAEAVTRFLRSRDEPDLAKLLAVAESLLNGSLPVYLPRKNVIILEWLFEKLASPDSKTKSSTLSGHDWRLSPQAWDLLSSAWLSVDTAEQRNHIFQSTNFLTAILIPTIEAASKDACNVSLFTSLSLAIDGFHSSRSMVVASRANQDAAVGQLLSAYATFLRHYLLPDQDLPEESVVSGLDLLSSSLLSVLDQNLRRDLKLKPALTARFLADTLVLVSQSHLASSVELFLHRSLQSLLLGESELPLAKVLKKEESHVRDNGVADLYQLVLSNSAKSAQTYFEQLVSARPSCSDVLLRLSLAHKVDLDAETLQSILESQVLSGTQNWSTAELLVRTNWTMVAPKAESIYQSIAGSPSDKQQVPLLTAIVKAHSQPGDFPEFFSRWKLLIREASIWMDKAVFDQVVSSLRILSSHQLGQLLEANVRDLSSEKATKLKRKRTEVLDPATLPLLALVTSAQDSPLKVSRSKELFESIVSASPGPIDTWQLKYLILSLNGDIVLDSSSNILDSAFDLLESSSKNVDWMYLYSTMFRAREFVDSEQFEAVCEKFLASAATHPALLSAVSRRWLILLNNQFSAANLRKLSELFLNSAESLHELVSNDLLFEQPKFTSAILDVIVSSLDNDPHHTYVDALSQFPIEVFSRAARVKILDTLAEHPNGQATISCIAHLLSRPAFASKIESDFKIIRDLFKTSRKDHNLRPIASLIVTRVLSHVAEKDSADESSFASDLLAWLKKTLQKQQTGTKDKDTWILHFASLVYANLEVDSNQLDAFVSILSDKLGTEDTSQVLALSLAESLRGLLGASTAERLSPAVLGNLKIVAGTKLSEALGKGQNETVDSLFSILASLPLDSEDFAALSAAFALINSSKLEQGYSAAVERAEPEWIDKIFNQVYMGFVAAESDSVGYVRLLSALVLSIPIEAASKLPLTRMYALFLNQSHRLDEDTVSIFVRMADTLLKDKSAAVSQHLLEIIIACVTKVASPRGPQFQSKAGPQQMYTDLTKVISSILLFHRHRITGRHHIVVGAFKSLLKCLCVPVDSKVVVCAPWVNSNGSPDASCAQAYSRLVSNLCEPPVQAVRGKGGKLNLTSSSTVAKRALAKHVGTILSSYVKMSLQVGFSSSIQTSLRPGIYPVFDILGADGTKTLSSMMDGTSRVFLRTVYDDYKLHGRWKDE